MQYADFKLGAEFFCSELRFRVTDIGWRRIYAVLLTPEWDQSWPDRQPDAMSKIVVDESDFDQCELASEDLASIPAFLPRQITQMLCPTETLPLPAASQPPVPVARPIPAPVHAIKDLPPGPRLALARRMIADFDNFVTIMSAGFGPAARQNVGRFYRGMIEALEAKSRHSHHHILVCEAIKAAYFSQFFDDEC